jgi:hypothetical protein
VPSGPTIVATPNLLKLLPFMANNKSLLGWKVKLVNMTTILRNGNVVDDVTFNGQRPNLHFPVDRSRRYSGMAGHLEA